MNGHTGLVTIASGNNQTAITPTSVTTQTVTQTSLEKIKKNITKFNRNAVEIIKNSSIYEYNLKSEKNTDKKHIGFVIGEKYNTPNEVISNDGQGIDAYSQRSITWKAVQEIIEVLEREGIMKWEK